MHVQAATNLACPMDGLPLAAHTSALRCGNGHSFDRAREGYWNLLVAQHKASRDPGDGKEMVAARRRFLEAGHFAPIAAAVFEQIVRLAAQANPAAAFTVADAGCGEGYYLDRLAGLAMASADTGCLELAGYDVSKWAVQAAARRTSAITWLVANSRNPPFATGSVRLLVCLFGFPVWEGFKSVQSPGDRLLLVDPGPDHLMELRQIIYPTVARSPPQSLTRGEAAGYALERQDAVRFEIALDGPQAIQDLVAMTPHAFRMAEAGRDALARLECLSVTVDVVARVMRLA